jgi:hypothetical protein
MVAATADGGTVVLVGGKRSKTCGKDVGEYGIYTLESKAHAHRSFNVLNMMMT